MYLSESAKHSQIPTRCPTSKQELSKKKKREKQRALNTLNMDRKIRDIISLFLLKQIGKQNKKRYYMKLSAKTMYGI